MHNVENDTKKNHINPCIIPTNNDQHRPMIPSACMIQKNTMQIDRKFDEITHFFYNILQYLGILE